VIVMVEGLLHQSGAVPASISDVIISGEQDTSVVAPSAVVQPLVGVGPAGGQSQHGVDSP
jgi:hypothetical protein